jgi:hypothetical protein
MQSIKSFTQYMADNYSVEELADIAVHGCEGGVSGMIYYNETTDLYNEYADDLHAIVGEWQEQTGMMPISITENLDNGRMFRNAMVWVSAQLVAGLAISHTVEA